jgi:hypothetical protein
MHRIGIVVTIIMAAMTAYVSLSLAQSPVQEFSCIVGTTHSGTECPDGTTSLRSYSAVSTASNYVSAAGYFTPGDGGGGEFYKLGIATSKCTGGPWQLSNPTGTVGGTTLTNNTDPPPAVIPGELVTGSGTNIFVQPGTEVVSANTTIPPYTVTLTLPLAGTATGSQSLSVSFTGDNNGTLIMTAGGNCYQKTNYRGEPHEYGAYGDGHKDDTLPLQDWMGAYGSPLATGQTRTNFGPWIATIPAVYDVQNLGTMMPNSGMNYPLACPPGAVLQAGANLWAGDKSSGTPSVRILADNSNGTWPTTGALLTLSDNCRLSGIAIDDGGLNAPLLGYTVDAVDIVGRDVAIDSHTLIQNGYININCALSGSQGVGLQVKDVQILGAVTDNVYIGQNCPNVRLIGDLNSGAGNRGVAFYGDDLTLADGAVEQSEGVGIDLETAHYVSITSNYIDHNGKAPPSSPSQPTNIFVNGGDHISICGNHIQGGGNSVPTGSGVYSSQIYLENPSENPIDSFSLCEAAGITPEIRPLDGFSAPPRLRVTNLF